MTDADTLRALRESAGLSANGLDARAGLSRGQVARYERGDAAPSIAATRRLCEALGVSLAAFDGAGD